MSVPEYTAEVVLPCNAYLGEGPIWDAALQRLLWVDIIKGRVHVFNPEDKVPSVPVVQPTSAKPHHLVSHTVMFVGTGCLVGGTQSDKVIEVGQMVGTVVPRVGGGAMVAAEHGLGELNLETGQLHIICHPEEYG